MKRDNLGRYLLIFLVLTLCVFGLFAIYSSSYYMAETNYGDSMYFVKKQMIGLLLGLVSLIVCMHIDYHILYKFRWIIFAISIVLLLLVFIPGLGKSNYGANRWITIGGLSIQSSEVAKFGFVIFASSYMSRCGDKMKTFKGMLPVLLSGGLICLLILLEPNLSVTLCVGCVMLLMLFVGGVKLKYFALFLVCGLLLLPVLIIIEPYRLQRLVAFVDPWENPLEEGFQLIQSLYSLGSGGLFGVGYMNSRQKYLFLPFAESDFILSVIGEEFGFFGIVALCLVYILIIILGIRIALKATDRLGSYLAFGITSVIAVQMLINFAVVIGAIPPTGIPLPFISAGGTSLMVFMGAVGILLNIANNERLSVKSVNAFKNIKNRKL